MQARETQSIIEAPHGLLAVGEQEVPVVGGAFEDFGLAGAADAVAAGGGYGDSGAFECVQDRGVGADLHGGSGAGADDVEAGVLAVAGAAVGAAKRSVRAVGQRSSTAARRGSGPQQ